MTYTPNLRFEDQANGENEDTWGEKTDQNLYMVEEAIAGFKSIDIAGSGGYTLAAYNAATDEARPVMLRFTGACTGAREIFFPQVPRVYILEDATTGGFSITARHAPYGSASVVIDGISIIRTDGSDMVDIVNSNANTYSEAQTVKKTGAASRFVVWPDGGTQNDGYHFVSTTGTDGGGIYKYDDDLKIHGSSGAIVNLKSGCKLIEADATDITYNGTSMVVTNGGDVQVGMDNNFSESQDINVSGDDSLLKLQAASDSSWASGFSFMDDAIFTLGKVSRANAYPRNISISYKGWSISCDDNAKALSISPSDITFDGGSLLSQFRVTINYVPTQKTIIAGAADSEGTGYRSLMVIE